MNNDDDDDDDDDDDINTTVIITLFMSQDLLVLARLKIKLKVTTIKTSQVEILLRSCKILQESCKILIKIKISIRSCLTFNILKNLSKNLVRS